MCKVDNWNNKELKRKSVTGYKAVIKIKDKYYSPCTGMKYEVGMKIPKMKKKRANAEDRWCDMVSKHDTFYEPLMQGRTGVFKTLEDLKYGMLQGRGNDYVILKMKLGGSIYEAVTNYRRTYIGSEILAFKEIKYKHSW